MDYITEHNIEIEDECKKGQTNIELHKLSFQDTERTYLVHLPADYNSSNSYPLMLNLHGSKSCAIEQMSYSSMNGIADIGNFIVIYPNGIKNTWNSGRGDKFNPDINDVGFISALIDTAIIDYSVDSTRVYAVGMSNGGIMCYRLGNELPNKIAAIASVAGGMSTCLNYDSTNRKPLPLMEIHGTADPIVNYTGTDTVSSVMSTINYWVKRNNCDCTPIITEISDINLTDNCFTLRKYYQNGLDSSEVVFIKIINGGHTWPGACPDEELGNTNRDFDASSEIWRFLRKHKLVNREI